MGTLCTQFINRYYTSMLQQQQLTLSINNKNCELDEYVNKCAGYLRDDTVLCVLKLF